MKDQRYINFLAKLGINSAHPGGRPLTEAMLSREAIGKDEDVLDVGCGTGETSAFLMTRYGCQVTAVDLHQEMVSMAREKAKSLIKPFKVIQANAEKLPFSKGSFNRVISESVTAFTNVAVSLAEFHRVLDEKGSLLAIEMTIEKHLSQDAVEEICSLYGINQLLTEGDWVEQLKDAGFSDISTFKGESFLLADQRLGDISTFRFSEKLDEEAFEVWMQHIQLMEKYKSMLSYRVYKAIK